MQNPKRKIVKALSITLSSLILLAFLAFGLLYFEAQTYLNKNLSEFVSKKSKGKYELTFENLVINFKQWGFEINQVSFHPSDSITKSLDQTNLKKQFYSFASPKISFKDIKLVRLIFQKKLKIGQIQITQPELNIHGKQTGPENQKNNISSILQELKPLVTKKFKSIQIDKIELVDASFDFYNLLGDTRKLSNAENITIGILNFYTDSLLLPDPKRLFNADDIYLRMHNYQNKLGDSIHTLSAEAVTYSLKKSQIEATNIELKPSNQLVSARNKYQITIPKAIIKSSHIHEFYQNKAIPIDSMVLTDAKIKYWPGQRMAGTPIRKMVDYDLYQLIDDEFSSVSIAHFKLKNAQLMLYKTQSDQAGQQELKNITLNLEDFLLDSITSQDTSRIFYSKNIDFSASEYELTLGDNIHRVKAQNLELSTREKSVLVKNIQIYPLQNGNRPTGPNNLIEATCDSIRLDLFNFKKAYHQKRFVFQRINLFNPEVKLTQNEQSKEKTGPQKPSFIYNLVSNYIQGIYSNQVTVQKGKFQIVNKTGVLQKGNIESNLKLQLTGFAMDEISVQRTDRLFYADQIELNLSNYQMQLVDQLHKLTIDNLAISTRKQQLKLQNLHLFPVSLENMEALLKQYGRSELYEFTIPELSLLNADFHNAFFNKKLTVDTLYIKTPQIYYENFALLKLAKPDADFEDLFELLSNYLDEIQIAKVEIPDGTIRLINHSKKDKTISLNNHFSLKLENTLINKEQFGQKKLLFSEFIDFSVRDHLIHLPDNVHVIKAYEAGFSTRRKEIYVLNARIYPETTSKDFSSINWNIQLTVPEIRIKGINIEEFYFNHKIDADNLLINSPDIKLYQRQKKAESNGLKEIVIPLPKEIESIAIRQFQLTDGSLKVFSEMGIKPYLILQSDLRMNARNILIQKDTDAGKPEFKTGTYTGDLLQFKFTPKDQNQQFSIDELSFSTSDHRILVSQLVLKPKTKNPKEDQFELNIPALALNGFDMDHAYRNDQFLFESIQIDKPSFQLFNNAKDSLKFNPFKINLYPYFESFAEVFASKSIHVTDADISVFKNGKKKFQEKIAFNLNDVRIGKESSQGFIHAEGYSFRIPNLKRQGKLYHYTIGNIFYSSASNRFSASDIHIIPNFSKEDHQKKVGFQSDYFTGKIDSIGIDQPNIRQWFDKEELIGKCLSVNGLKLDIYRDKRTAFDQNRRPEMPQDLIKSLKYPFHLDSFKMVNSNIIYTEHHELADREGKISFDSIQARLMPFTNMKSSARKIPDFNLNGTATIMDSCKIMTNMNFQMNDPENLFTVNGSLSPFNMRILNPVLEPLASVSIRSGKVDRFNFTFSADKTSAIGHLFFGYDDLKISVLETKNGNIKEAKLASFLANSILLRSKNPRGNEILLPEKINIQRDQKHSVLNYLWKSVFSGVRNTLGIKENKQEVQEEK